jgi:hypothetical protein
MVYLIMNESYKLVRNKIWSVPEQIVHAEYTSFLHQR